MWNSLPFVIAHGALGPWDELIFLGVVVIFIMMMVVSWFRSRDIDWDAIDDPNNAISNKNTQNINNDLNQSNEHFSLD